MIGHKDSGYVFQGKNMTCTILYKYVNIRITKNTFLFSEVYSETSSYVYDTISLVAIWLKYTWFPPGLIRQMVSSIAYISVKGPICLSWICRGIEKLLCCFTLGVFVFFFNFDGIKHEGNSANMLMLDSNINFLVKYTITESEYVKIV